MKKNYGKSTNLIALMLFLFIIATFLLSSYYVIHNRNHSCIGERCPICQQINICSKTIQKLGDCIPINLITAFLLILCLMESVLTVTRDENNKTLVHLKVRLNN